MFGKFKLLRCLQSWSNDWLLKEEVFVLAFVFGTLSQCSFMPSLPIMSTAIINDGCEHSKVHFDRKSIVDLVTPSWSPKILPWFRQWNYADEVYDNHKDSAVDIWLSTFSRHLLIMFIADQLQLMVDRKIELIET